MRCQPPHQATPGVRPVRLWNSGRLSWTDAMLMGRRTSIREPLTADLLSLAFVCRVHRSKALKIIRLQYHWQSDTRASSTSS